jgi:hypothetical protein
MKNNLQSVLSKVPVLIAATLTISFFSSCSTQMGCPGSIVNGNRMHGHYSSINKNKASQPSTIGYYSKQQIDKNTHNLDNTANSSVLTPNAGVNHTNTIKGCVTL